MKEHVLGGQLEGACPLGGQLEGACPLGGQLEGACPLVNGNSFYFRRHILCIISANCHENAVDFSCTYCAKLLEQKRSSLCGVGGDDLG